MVTLDLLLFTLSLVQADVLSDLAPDLLPSKLRICSLYVRAELDKSCIRLLTIPGAAAHADLDTRLKFIKTSRDKLKLSQSKNWSLLGGTSIETEAGSPPQETGRT